MVDTKNRNFNKFLNQNQTMRHVIAGNETMQINASLYVPKLDGQDTKEFQGMISRSVFENFTARTLDGISGLIFAKSPIAEMGSRLKSFEDNIDLDNSTLTDFAQTVVSEVTTVGRAGILVDMASVDTNGMSAADVEAMNIRPYFKLYPTESVINWRTSVINNVTVLSMLVLHEVYDFYIDEFQSEQRDRYRVYSLQENICVVRVYEKKDKQFALVDESIPMMNGSALNFIPFVSITPDNLTIEPKKSPLIDIADVNINLYQTHVDFSWGSHFTALPTAYCSGVQLQQGETIKLGSSYAHVFPDPNASMAYLEFAGDGLQTLERKMASSKEAMAVLGARLLASEASNISENTLTLRTSGERAAIVSIADTVSRGITKALEIMALWSGDNTEVSYKLNTDYNLSQLDAQSLTALISAWQMGALSSRALFLNLQKGEIIEEDVVYEDYQAELQEQSPALSVTPTPAK
jgi:hypothetical protein